MITGICALLLLGPVGAKPFMDQVRSLLPGQDWNREIVARHVGKVRISVDSQGAFSFSLIAARSWKAIQSQNMREFHKSDVIATFDVKGPSLSYIARLPAGSTYIMVTNNMKSSAKVRLRCWND